MTKWTILAGAALGAALPLSPALADNGCAVQAPAIQPQTVIVTYDPFDAATANSDFLIRLDTVGCPPNRNLFLELDPVDPTQSDGTSIRFAGSGGSSLLAAISDQRGGQGHGRDDFFNVTAGSETFYLVVPRGQIVPPGDYRAQVRAAVRLNNGRGEPEAQTPFEIVIRVGAAIGLVPAIGRGLDLGELRDGDRADTPVTFDAYANVPYRLTVRSDFGYVLRRGGLATSSGPAYLPQLDSDLLTTSAPQRDFPLPPANLWRRRHSLDVQVPSIAGQQAGTYRDYLTVEIGALLGE
ncbi:hypothetical protein GCM10022280_08910 [Sphingomonas swuensis]|uniref:Spore coat protein U domain-containing protein n=1 Tax=Sphingomonas swuensis TaxID=977800 RepID=A0ABP7SLM0_9SPHN